MTTGKDVFIPGAECWKTGGDCLMEGKCLGKCTPRLPAAAANEALATALRLLAQITDYTSGMRQITRYVDGSSIDNSMNEAKQLIRKHKPWPQHQHPSPRPCAWRTN